MRAGIGTAAGPPSRRCTPAAAAQPGTQRITPNFKDADITQIIEAVTMATGKNFIIDPRVRAQVTMLSSTPMTPDQFYQAFLAILQVHGFVAVPAGSVIKIVPDANMRQYAANDLPDHVSSSSDEMVTQVLAVQNVNASQLVPVLRPLMPQNAQLSAVTGSNILILSDHASNVNRMMRIIARIDQTGSSDIDVIPLQSATAADTARVLTTLLAQTGEAASGVKIVADDRSNSILVSGDATLRLKIRTLVTHLDTPIDTGSTTVVRYLRFSDAEDLAGRLKEQLSGGSSGSGFHHEQAAGAQSELSNRSPMPRAIRPRPARVRLPMPAPRGGGAATLSLAGGTATIWADKATNSLVITAGQRTLRAVNAVIDKLDIRRAQVLVQAIIVVGVGRQGRGPGRQLGGRCRPRRRGDRRLHRARSAASQASICTTTSSPPATWRPISRPAPRSASANSRPAASISRRSCAPCRATPAPTSSPHRRWSRATTRKPRWKWRRKCRS